jgi:hypothetical protein
MEISAVFSRRAAGSGIGVANVDSTKGATGVFFGVAGDEQPTQSKSQSGQGASRRRVLDKWGSLMTFRCRKALLADFRDAER